MSSIKKTFAVVYVASGIALAGVSGLTELTQSLHYNSPENKYRVELVGAKNKNLDAINGIRNNLLSEQERLSMSRFHALKDLEFYKDNPTFIPGMYSIEQHTSRVNGWVENIDRDLSLIDLMLEENSFMNDLVTTKKNHVASHPDYISSEDRKSQRRQNGMYGLLGLGLIGIGSRFK